MWFLPRNRLCLSARGPPPFRRWCIATILCVLKPHNVRSIAEREATSRNVLSQMCTMFWCQSTSPGRLQCSRQAGEVLVKFQFQFVPYKSGFKTHKCCTSPNRSHRISQCGNDAKQLTVRYHYAETSQQHYNLASWRPSASHPTFFYRLFSFTFYIFNFRAADFHFYGLSTPTGKESLPQNCLCSLE